MDVLDHLTQEHRKVESMLEKLADSEEGAERRSTIEELDDALSTHMAVEEAYLYPLVEQVIDRESEREAETEHELARDGLAQLRDLADKPGFGAAVEMVKAGIAHHVEDEESEIFPELRTKAGDRLAQLDPEELESKVRSGSGSDDRTTKEELYRAAQEAGIEGRSTMSKDELADALERE